MLPITLKENLDETDVRVGKMAMVYANKGAKMYPMPSGITKEYAPTWVFFHSLGNTTDFLTIVNLYSRLH